MVNVTLCDIRGCEERAVKEQVDMCTGYSDYYGTFEETTQYEPFEKPSVGKRDLCKKHFKIWCEATYTAFYKVV